MGGKDCRKRVELILDTGYGIDTLGFCGGTPAMSAHIHHHHNIAVYLLERGANPDAFYGDTNKKLIHLVVGKENRPVSVQANEKVQLQRLLDELIRRGQDVDEARAFIADARKFRVPSELAEYNRKQKKIREAREQKVVKGPEHQ